MNRYLILSVLAAAATQTNNETTIEGTTPKPPTKYKNAALSATKINKNATFFLFLNQHKMEE